MDGAVPPDEQQSNRCQQPIWSQTESSDGGIKSSFGRPGAEEGIEECRKMNSHLMLVSSLSLNLPQGTYEGMGRSRGDLLLKLKGGTAESRRCNESRLARTAPNAHLIYIIIQQVSDATLDL